LKSDSSVHRHSFPPQPLSSLHRLSRFHGDFGLLLWDLLCVTILFGQLSFSELNVLSSLSIFSLLLLWFTLHKQMKIKLDPDESYSAAVINIEEASDDDLFHVSVGKDSSEWIHLMKTSLSPNSRDFDDRSFHEQQVRQEEISD
jgi:hypothetical protein